MVSNVTSLTNNGLRDWLIQRVSAVVLAVYFIFLFVYLCLHPQLTYVEWENLFANPVMKTGTLLALLSLLVHAWIGIWTVTTDYLKSMPLRITIQMLVLLGLLGLFFWGILILWG
jgi:succinate dehydrogenase / fumarate reductase membrane anchor subunit